MSMRRKLYIAGVAAISLAIIFAGVVVGGRTVQARKDAAAATPAPSADALAHASSAVSVDNAALLATGSSVLARLQGAAPTGDAGH